MIFKALEKRDQSHEKVVFCYDHTTQLKAIIAIHSTTLGPALGGCRMHPYLSEEEALEDALRLSEAMSYKAAMAGLQLGGGKSVIIGDPKRDKNPEALWCFGHHLESLNGQYIVAKDMGINTEDLQYISTLPPFVAGYSKKLLASFIAIPVVFWLKRNVQLCLNSSEVEAAFWTPLDFFLSTGHLQVDTFTNNRSGQKFEILFFNFTDKASRKKFLIFGCTASICVTVSSIALNRAPEFPCTALGLYWHKQELVVSEVSRSTLNSTSHTSDWNYIPYAVKSKL